jgi:uncharacterized membrane protein
MKKLSVLLPTWLRYGIWLILPLAFALSFFNLGARTWHGDELSSVANALGARQNPQALAYFLLLRVWLLGGNSEFWLRALSALFAVLNVAIAYRAVTLLASRHAAIVVSLLFATSPFVLEFAHQVRFYTMFLMAAGASIWSLLYFLQQRTRRVFVLWLGITIVMLTTHAMSFVVLLFEILTLWLVVPRIRLRYRIGVLTLVAGLGALVIVSPLRIPIFAFVARYTDAMPMFDQSRGLSVSQLAKLPLTFFFFSLGQYVYPLDWYLVAPGVILYLAAIGAGIYHIRHRRAQLLLFALLGLGAPLLLYLALDALIPTTFAGAAPRYLIFLLPVFYFLAGVGAASLRWGFWFAIGLVLVNLLAVNSMWRATWAYTDDLVNWRQVTQWVGNYITPQTLILADGRAQASADYYFPAEWHRRGTWHFQAGDPSNNLDDYSRIILLSSNFHADSRIQATRLMQKIASRFDQVAVWNKYPLFVYVYDRKTDSPGAYRVDAFDALNLPHEIYGLPFQDLRLPLALTIDNRTVESSGAFGLPGLERQMTRTISLSSPMSARALWLASNLVGANAETGKSMGYLKIVDENGAAQKIPLRYGFETSAWNQPCQPNACASAFTWRKRLALLGSESYPGSWQEFDASIFSARIDFVQATRVRAIKFERLDAPGVLYIWSIVFQP